MLTNFGMIYLAIAIIFYVHNKDVGPEWTGIVVYSIWFLIPPVWCLGVYLVWKENKDIEKIVKKKATKGYVA